ncbi:hypothetical protein TELCIR_18580 [Teladorsagia circumcincta]|uniref:Protein kinase domain-containing protein n=1 Tax=Teladorsagia circumcincta TaxID=45464 RepID=A0A2G9TR42_TELCI|nr:hypothetical protein TELCIR_18580 [Teladorsagia circumcincta]
MGVGDRKRREASMTSIHRQMSTIRYVVPLLAAINTDQVSYLVFPFYRRGSVGDDLLRRRPKNDYLTQEEVVRIFLGLCTAVRHLHQLGYVHRDLKVSV